MSFELVHGEATNPTWFVEEQTAAAVEGVSATSPAAAIAAAVPLETRWRPLFRRDQEVLEEACALKEPPVAVGVDGGRAEVWLADRLFVDRYAALPPAPPCSVRRSLWVRLPIAGGPWEPFEEAHDVVLEQAYQDLVQNARDLSMAGHKVAKNAQVSRSVQMPGNRMLQMRLQLTSDPLSAVRAWEMSAEERATGLLQSAQSSILGRSTSVRRGYGSVPLQLGEAEEEALSEDIGNLFLLVHDASGATSSRNCGRCFRRNMHRSQLLAAGYVQHADGEGPWRHPDAKPPKMRKDEVIEVAWPQQLRTPELASRLVSSAPKSAQRERSVANTAMTDAMLFLHQGKRAEVELAVGQMVEAAMAMFLERRPNFRGNVVVIGRGLVSAVLFELVRKEKLSFRPSVLVAMGSPLGALLPLLAASGEEVNAGSEESHRVPPLQLSPYFRLPRGVRLLNLLHAADPLAYRMEPLLAPEYEQVPPEQVPEVSHSISKTALEGTTKGSTQLSLNDGARVDWVLAAASSSSKEAAEGASEALSAIRASYLESAEVISFVQAASTMLSTWGTDGSLDDFLSDDIPWKVPSKEVEPSWSLRRGGSALLPLLTPQLSFIDVRDRLQCSTVNGVRGLGQGLTMAGTAVANTAVADTVAKKCKETGATDLVVGTYHAAAGVVGTARAVGGAVRLVSTGVGGVRGLVNLGRGSVSR